MTLLDHVASTGQKEWRKYQRNAPVLPSGGTHEDQIKTFTIQNLKRFSENSIEGKLKEKTQILESSHLQMQRR